MKVSAWAIVSLGLLTAVPAVLKGQESQQQGDRVELRQNYPNPFNPETTIPFKLSASLFADGARPVVSLKIYNVLAQLVAIPILQGSGEPLDNVRLEWNGTGEYSAYWDGKVIRTDREAASGVYVYQLVVNGERHTGKMTIVK
jgi:hypothetical protein